MSSSLINLTTGPVSLSPTVIDALAGQPVSHRSHEFGDLLNTITASIKNHFHANDVFIFSGSGTSANYAMLYQVRCLNKRGIILSNGEFGERLVKQAATLHLEFDTLVLDWGQEFDLHQLGRLFANSNPAWIVYCHCETSTGVVNDMAAINEIANNYNCLSFVDCISSVGTMKMDLEHIAMATASSGKGLCCIPGLALVFSNIPVQKRTDVPQVLDLGFYAAKKNLPFTLSSNLLRGLQEGCRLKLNEDSYSRTQAFCEKLKNLLNSFNLLPFTSQRVFTIQWAGDSQPFISRLAEKNIVISYNSDYLRKRNWVQAAIFSSLSNTEMDDSLLCFEEILAGLLQKEKPTEVRLQTIS